MISPFLITVNIPEMREIDILWMVMLWLYSYLQQVQSTVTMASTCLAAVLVDFKPDKRLISNILLLSSLFVFEFNNFK